MVKIIRLPPLYFYNTFCMMDPEYYQPEDFAADDSFINYCFKNNREDYHFWKQWLDDHPEKKEMAERAKEMVWLMSVRLSPEEKKREWEKVKLNQGQEDFTIPEKVIPSLNSKLRTGLAALVVVFILAIAASFWLINKKPQANRIAVVHPVKYHTLPGQKDTIILKDGTHVWLNADSKLICDKDFGQSPTREVTLTGEAYFDVSKDPGRPFVIHANNMNIKVLGTAFNVKAYPDGKTTETTLLRGSIEVTIKDDPSRKIRLRPNEKITVFKATASIESIHNKQELNLKKDTLSGFSVSTIHQDPLLDSGVLETAWMEGKLAFRNETFDQLALQMKHKYDVEFHFMTDDLKAFRFTGIFSTETIGQALHALQLTSPSNPFDYHVEGREVYIMKDKR